MNQPSLFDEQPERNLGERLKADGIRIVLDNQGEDWASLAAHLVEAYIAKHGPCLMEDARAFAVECGLPQPSHPNAWGAVASGLSRSGRVQMTGEWVKSQAVKAHARMAPVWMMA